MASAWRVFLIAAAMMVVAGPSHAGTYQTVASEVGIEFAQAGEVHPPDSDWPGFPEIIGGGACFADFDGDGYDDLYLTQQRFNPDNPATEGWIDDYDPRNKMYLNNGDGTFTDWSAHSGTDSARFGLGCSAADYDGDGDIDLYVANYGDERFGANELFRNRGNATFDEVGVQAGVDMPNACGEFPCMSTNSAWADYDADGDLDLYVGNYVGTTLDDTRRGPGPHPGQPNMLFRNEGDGTFTEVGAQSNVNGHNGDTSSSKTFAVLWFDYDLDGDMDIYACHDGPPNNLYTNMGDGTFEDLAVQAGVDDHRSSMGCASGDYDNDGLPDLYMTHYFAQADGFYRNNGDGTFEDRSAEDDQEMAGTYVGWGTAFIDYDRDGDLDLFSVNGHTDWTTEIGNAYNEPALVVRQDPPLAGADPWDAEWVDVTPELGPGVNEKLVSRGSAYADYDLDGDTDVAVSNNANQTMQFLRADFTGLNWLTLQLRQPGANVHAVGARVSLEAGGVEQWREVQAGASYLSQSTLNLEFGLGAHTKADKVTVHWPGGGTSVFTDLAKNQVLRLDRATGAVVNDTLAPVTTVHTAGPEGGEDGWFLGDFTVTLSAQDRGVTWQSGVVRTEYAIDDGPWQLYTGEPIPFTGEGVQHLHVRSFDAAGNVEPRRTTPLGIDLSPPEVPEPSITGTQGLEDWWVSPSVNVSLKAADALSGVASFRYRLDGGAWTQVRGPFTVSGDGIHTLDTIASDRAGNLGDVTTFEVRIDATLPEVALSSPREGGLYVGNAEMAQAPGDIAVLVATPALGTTGGENFTVRASASDAASGVDRVVFRIDGRVVAVDHEAPFTWTWKTRDWDSGPYRVEAIAVDQAGHLNGHEVDVVLVSGGGDQKVLRTGIRQLDDVLDDLQEDLEDSLPDAPMP